MALSAALMVMLSVWTVSPARAASESCTSHDVVVGNCAEVSGSIKDGGVALGGSQSTPGNGAPRSGGAAAPRPGTSTSPLPIAAPPAPSSFPDRTWAEFTVTGPALLSDLVNFRPTPGTSLMEPKGWTIVGAETNFYSQANAQVQDGELLGQPASVRFSPVRYRWSYGDGTEAVLGTGGGSWASQGIHEFDKTSTSHRYRRVGTYTVEHSVEFAAEYRFAGGAWTPIAGTIRTRANDLVVSVGNARTVLVARECTRNPAGSGC